jgi:hypothetical protein
MTQHTEELLAAIGDELTTVQEVLKKKPWCTTMMEELESIKENETWSLVHLPSGHKAISLKWVFKLKHDEQGRVVKHKARLVTNGYVQRQGVDSEEVFVLVAQMESVRVTLTVVSHHGWTMHHMDVKSTFLNGDLAEEVYVQQPPGFTVNDGRGRSYGCTRLSMDWGRHQEWNFMLDRVLHELSFLRCKLEHGLYTRVMKKIRVVVGVYVDDLIIMGESEKEVQVFKE